MSAAGMIISFMVMLLALGGADYYIARRLYQCISFILPQINTGIYTGVSVFIAFVIIFGFARTLLPVPRAIKNVLGFIGSYGMGIMIYLLLFFVMADVVLLLGKMIRVIPDSMSQGLRFYSGWIVVLLTIGTVSYGIYNANQIKHVSYDIGLKESALASELKIVLISDLHLGALHSEKRLENMVQEINALQPDLVCIAGDIFDNDYYAIHNPEEAIGLLKDITAAYGVYASLGNHDGGETVSEMLSFLKRSNINVLNDEFVIIGGQLALAGRLDSAPIGGWEDMSRRALPEVMAGVDLKLPVVVMDHNPANIDEYGSEIDLILAGHTHRGQLFPGSLFTRAMFVVDYGHYQKDGNSPHVVVTSGVGTWGMPMRVGTNNEIVSILLHPVGGSNF